MAIDIGKFIGRFVEEARDHLARLDEGLAALEAGRTTADGINALFRSAHTIKGSSRMLKLAPITEVAHHLEDVLGALRDASLRFDPALGQLLHRGVDAIAALVDHLAEHRDPASLPGCDSALCQALARAASGAGAETAATPAPAAIPAPAAPAAPAPEPAAPDNVIAATPPEEHRLKTAETVRVRLSNLDALIKLMGEVISSHARLRALLHDLHRIERETFADASPAQRGALRHFALELKDDVQTQEALMVQLHDRALVMRMLPLAIVFEPAARLVRELAQSVGKTVECLIQGAEIELDRQLIDSLADPIIHLLRNAIDHGLETPDRRRAAGKPEQGRVRLSARQDGSWVLIEIADDGGGIPLAAVRDKAIRKGLLTPEQAAVASDRELIDLIFLPGFSTNSFITDLSGRGVGMDVVKQCVVDDLQGVVTVETSPGRGTTFSLRLPLSLAVMRVLLVAAGGRAFGFTAQHVAELLRVPRAALLDVADRNAVIVRNEFVPVVGLADLLRLPDGESQPAAHRGRDRGRLLVILRVRHEKIAVAVDDLLDERDLILKPLPEHLRHLTLVAGMVTAGRDTLVSVLHAPALLELAGQMRRRAVHEQAVAHAPEGRRAWRLLVVDDSLNTREIEKDVLEAHGYQVTLAEDGARGLERALAETFDAVLTDVEMPNMDGFTLTARLRQEAAYRTTPIIIITSREKEEDKRRGIQVGADAYIVKGDFDQTNLVDTLQALLG